MKIIIAIPFYGPLGIFYALLAVLMMPFFAASFAKVLESVGIHPIAAVVLALSVALLSLLTSPINVVVYTASRRHYVSVVDTVVVFGIPFPAPRVAVHEERSYVAVNVGGAVIPLAVATYLFAKVPSAALLASIAVASLLVNAVSKVVRGVGVVTPAFAPPLIAVLSALIAGGGPVAT